MHGKPAASAARLGSPLAEITRRRFLVGSGAGLAAAAGLGIEGLILEPGRLSVSSHVLGTSGSGATPIRLAVLADLHLNAITGLHERIAEALNAAEPSAVLLVGDSIDDAANLFLLRRFLDLLPPGGRRVATLGNWEHWSRVDLVALRSVYEAAETRLLVNESVEVERDAFLFGTDDALAGSPRLDRLADERGQETVLLSHSPAFRDTLDPADRRIRAMIAGHTHGGQVAVGRWAPILPPGSGGYVSGWYRGSGPDLFVTRGVGTSVLPVRLGSPPELALIDWYPRTAWRGAKGGAHAP